MPVLLSLFRSMAWYKHLGVPFLVSLNFFVAKFFHSSFECFVTMLTLQVLINPPNPNIPQHKPSSPELPNLHWYLLHRVAPHHHLPRLHTAEPCSIEGFAFPLSPPQDWLYLLGRVIKMIKTAVPPRLQPPYLQCTLFLSVYFPFRLGPSFILSSGRSVGGSLVSNGGCFSESHSSILLSNRSKAQALSLIVTTFAWPPVSVAFETVSWYRCSPQALLPDNTHALQVGPKNQKMALRSLSVVALRNFDSSFTVQKLSALPIFFMFCSQLFAWAPLCIQCLVE